MNPINNYVGVLKNYAVFSGRASRAEFWWFVLINLIISVVLSIISLIIGDKNGILSTLYSLAILIPSLAVGVRRLHDIGKSGWWLLIALIPIIGSIILIVFYVMDSQAEQNQYGQNPKGAKPASTEMPEPPQAPTPPTI